MPRLRTDLDRADDAIRAFRLSRPADPVGQFTYPRRDNERRDLADFIYDVADEHAARAALEAPARRVVTWTPPRG